MARVLYISGERVTLYETGRNGAEPLAHFPCRDTGYAELHRLLIDAEPQPVSLLVDLIEEEFREEALPHTLGFDRSRLYARHASKLFRNTPFRHHRCIGRKSDGRRDDLVRFSALTNRDNIEPILEVLGQASVPVKGIYSLPMITTCLLQVLGVGENNILMVTEQPDGGLRQTFIHKQEVHFSRLAPVGDQSPTDYCQILEAEASKTRRYLHTLRLLPQDQPLDVYALCDRERVTAVQAMHATGSDISFHSADLVQIARKAGFRNYPDTRFSDALFCYLLDKRRIGNHYAQAPHLRSWRSYQARLGMRAATWLLAVGAITFSGINIIDGGQMKSEARDVVRVTDQVNAAYQQVRQGLTVNPDKALSMREAVQLAERLTGYPADLDALFNLVGHGFATQTELAMDKFSWFVTGNRNAVNAPAINANARESVSVETPFLVSHVGGHVRDFAGSYQAAEQQIDAMASWLSVQAGVVAADVVRKPLNTRTDAILQGGIAAHGDRGVAEFELRIVLELRHDPV